MHKCIYAYIHTYIHAYMHTCLLFSLPAACNEIRKKVTNTLTYLRQGLRSCDHFVAKIALFLSLTFIHVMLFLLHLCTSYRSQLRVNTKRNRSMSISWTSRVSSRRPTKGCPAIQFSMHADPIYNIFLDSQNKMIIN